jgi:CyaY protein
MDEREFLTRAEALFTQLETVLDAAEADIDYERAPGGVLELTFADGSQMVINRHVATREIWVAARRGGFHFRWDGTHWVDTRSGEELGACLARLIGEQAGVTLVF